ncbi:FeoA family protein [Helicobacter suis]|uniref:FeoA family protein n=1 Tax=Helicobacter suis TaxID=104628 RepID=UPI0013D89A84|nr:FeoA family protein [Helicobacter suis]
MNLLECQKNKRYGIVGIATQDSQLKNRFLSFGIIVGEEITLLQHSMKKATFSIEIGHAQIALRAHEAQCVLVNPL